MHAKSREMQMYSDVCMREAWFGNPVVQPQLLGNWDSLRKALLSTSTLGTFVGPAGACLSWYEGMSHDKKTKLQRYRRFEMRRISIYIRS